jgi:hypothetical protein
MGWFKKKVKLNKPRELAAIRDIRKNLVNKQRRIVDKIEGKLSQIENSIESEDVWHVKKEVHDDSDSLKVLFHAVSIVANLDRVRSLPSPIKNRWKR